MAEASRITYSSLREDLNEQQWTGNETLATLKRYHDKAYADIDMALRLEERSNLDEAIRFYSLGLKSISKAMAIDCKASGGRSESQWERARSMQQKMKMTVMEIKKRLESLEEEARLRQVDRTSASGGACGGAITRSRSNAGSCQDEPDSDILDIYRESSAPQDLPSYAQSMADASQVLHIPHGVQLFFINSSGHVSAPSSPGPLKVYKFPESQPLGPNQPPAFLQIGEWLYPLLPGQSPSLKAADGVFMFPDVSSLDQGASVGVIFSPQVTKSQKTQFQQIIQQLTAMKEEQIPSLEGASASRLPVATASRTPAARSDERGEAMDVYSEEVGAQMTDVGQMIAKGIEVGAEWLSWGVVKGAELGSRLVGSGAQKLKQHIQPDEQPAEIDQKYQTGAVYARKASGVAVQVSLVVLDSVCYLTKRIAGEVAPVISKQANKLMSTGDDEADGKTKAVVDGVITVTASGIKGFGTIYRGLETAAIHLAKGISQATVETVQHKYGEDAGKLADNSLAAACNLGLASHNMSHLGVKALAKRTAKDTGKAVVTDMETEAKVTKY